MKFRSKIRKVLFQLGIGCLSIVLISILNVKRVNAADAAQWPVQGVIVDRAWLWDNLQNENVLFIQLSKDGPYTIDRRDYPGYLNMHIITNRWGEAVQTPWPWDPANGKEHETPDVLIFTMKGSAHIKCTGTPETGGTCWTNAPGMLAPLDPLARTVAEEFERMGISHGCPECPNNDIDIVIYPERLPHDYLWATTLYWLLEFYGYPSDKLHILDGGLQGWVNDGGNVTSGPGPQIPAATFIPNVKPEIFADKTVVKAISEGLLKGTILDVRKPDLTLRGKPYPNNREQPIEPGRDSWPFPPWWDFMQGYHFKNDVLYAWYDSVAGVGGVKPNKCDDINNCEWKSPIDLQLQFDDILGTNFNKDDNITMY